MGGGKVKMGIVIGTGVVAIILTVVTVNGDDDSADIPSEGIISVSGADSRSAPVQISTEARVRRHEALPCTGPDEPTNFEIFSAGPSVAGLPLARFSRRCDSSAPAEEAPANFTNYLYGRCQIAEGATGCAPPLQVQTWPACQRTFADYSYAGRPLPHKELPRRDGAVVVEIDFFLDNRIEVYTKSSTIVIFAENPDVAKQALAQLISQDVGQPPATKADQLDDDTANSLGPPSQGAMEGKLQCQS